MCVLLRGGGCHHAAANRISEWRRDSLSREQRHANRVVDGHIKRVPQGRPRERDGRVAHQGHTGAHASDGDRGEDKARKEAPLRVAFRGGHKHGSGLGRLTYLQRCHLLGVIWKLCTGSLFFIFLVYYLTFKYILFFL